MVAKHKLVFSVCQIQLLPPIQIILVQNIYLHKHPIKNVLNGNPFISARNPTSTHLSVDIHTHIHSQ